MQVKIRQKAVQDLSNAVQNTPFFLEQDKNGRWLVKEDKHAGLDPIERQERQHLDNSFWKDLWWAIGGIVLVLLRGVVFVLVHLVYYAVVLIGYVLLSIGQLLTSAVPSPRRSGQGGRTSVVDNRPQNITINQNFYFHK